MRGKTVLLYFQEGITCQPCWDQLKDVETHEGKFKAFGIDQVVSVTTDPLGALTQKTKNEGISTLVLSDPNLTVSKSYDANKYGMMGTSRDGHTFIVVDSDGKIKWRADYGGAPKYTMYVPVDDLLSDMRQGLKGGSR
jgi:peroxiredoxin